MSPLGPLCHPWDPWATPGHLASLWHLWDPPKCHHWCHLWLPPADLVPPLGPLCYLWVPRVTLGTTCVTPCHLGTPVAPWDPLSATLGASPGSPMLTPCHP